MRGKGLSRGTKNSVLLLTIAICLSVWSIVLLIVYCSSKIYYEDPNDSNLPDPSINHIERTLLSSKFLLAVNNSVIQYAAFSTSKPYFIDKGDEALFWRNDENRKAIETPPPEQLVGQIRVWTNRAIHSNHACGWQRNETFTAGISKWTRIRRHVDYLLPLLVPQSNGFAHFIDGVLPKLMQAFHIVNSTHQIKLLILRPWDRNIEHILSMLGIPEERILYYDSGYYQANYVLDTCVTPPLHPNLWHKVRLELGVEVHNSVRHSEGYVLYVSRKGTRNYGRNILNEDEIIEYLTHRYGDAIQIIQKPKSIYSTKDLFRNARILLGVHGGALYNLMFCPKWTEIIEIMPTESNGDIVPASMHAHTMVWKMSSMLGQRHWRFIATPENEFGDVKIDWNKLKFQLDIIDKLHSL